MFHADVRSGDVGFPFWTLGVIAVAGFFSLAVLKHNIISSHTCMTGLQEDEKMLSIIEN